ncbi:MAG: CBS domain-containing protein [Gemmatimonadetes bacterium]|nr:CBS domain-containing protein [Gemmatimonadota bacterium]
MKRVPLLRREHVVVPLPASTMAGALEALTERLETTGLLRDPEVLQEGLASNLERATIVIAPDVVLPHFRTDAIADLAIALGVTAEPIDLGHARVRVVALVLAPPDAASTYLRAVSALARVFRQQPVMEQLLAARSADDVLAIPKLASLHVRPRLTVGDVMGRNVTAISPDTTVREAVAHFATTGLRALPVVGEKGEVLGVVSEADVLGGMLLGGSRDPAGDARRVVPPMMVRDVMTRSVMCIAESTELEEAARLMVSKDLDLFPVVKEGRLSGLISRSDILRQLYGR